MYPLGLVLEDVTKSRMNSTDAEIGIYRLKSLESLDLVLGFSLTRSVCLCLDWLPFFVGVFLVKVSSIQRLKISLWLAILMEQELLFVTFPIRVLSLNQSLSAFREINISND